MDGLREYWRVRRLPPPRGPERRARPAMLASIGAAMVLVSAPSCNPSAADDLARAIRPFADDVDTLRGSSWVPDEAPPSGVLPSGGTVTAEAARLAAPLDSKPSVGGFRRTSHQGLECDGPS